MKARKGFRVTDLTGTEWDGDCAKWAEDARKQGLRVTPLRIVGPAPWPCSACIHGLRH